MATVYTYGIGTNGTVPVGGSAFTPSGGQSVLTLTTTETQRSQKTSNRLVNRWRNPSAYSRSTFVLSNWSGLAAYWTGYGDRATAIQGCCYGILPNIWNSNPRAPEASSSMVAKAETHCLLRIRDQKMNLAVSVAEVSKTIDMVTSRTLTLFKAYKQAKRGNIRAAARELGVSDKRGKRQAKSWLELQYGWLPVLLDIKGAYDFLKTLDEFKVSSRFSAHEQLPTPSFAEAYGYAVKCSQQGYYGVKVRLDYVLTSQELKKASQIGLDDPASFAWEVTPFSFVVDWIVPVGDWLAALSATTGLSFKGGSKTYYGFKEALYEPVAAPNRWYPWVLTGKARASSYHRYMRREVYASSPIPALRVENPFNGSVTRALNAISLLRVLT